MDILDKLLFNLQTVAAITKGCRISTSKEFISIEEDSALQGLWRWKQGDTRDKAVMCITKDVHIVIKLADLLIELVRLSDPDSEPRKKYIYDLRHIYTALANSIVGLSNLCDTYGSDANVVGYIHPLTISINAMVDRLMDFLVELGVYEDVPKDVYRERIVYPYRRA
jgi:hypothetical protein